MKRSVIIIIILAACVFIATSEHLMAGEEEGVMLEALIDEALSNNLRMQAAHDSWRAMEYEIMQASSLSDPELEFSYFGENVETKVGPQERKYSLSQMIPFPGKLGLKGKIAEKGTRILEEKYETTKREVIKKVKEMYYDIWWVDKAIEVTESEKDIVSSLERVANQKFETDQAPQQDAIKAQVLISNLLNKLIQLRQQRNSMILKMNTLLNRPTDTSLGKLREIEIMDFNHALSNLQGFSQENRQELKIGVLGIQKKELQVALAKKAYLPNFMLGFSYIQVGDGYTAMSEDGKDAWMGMVSVNIPIWFKKLRAQLRQNQLDLEAGRKSYRDTQNSVLSEVNDVYFKLNTDKEQISLYETLLIPQTEHAFQAAKSAYENGKVDFLNLLDSERALLNTRLLYYRTIADYHKSIAAMERMVGRDL
ncbi:MAG: TolC family protein [bacterium]